MSLTPCRRVTSLNVSFLKSLRLYKLITLTLTGNFNSVIHEACELGIAILADSACQIAKPNTKSNVMCILSFDSKGSDLNWKPFKLRLNSSQVLRFMLSESIYCVSEGSKKLRQRLKWFANSQPSFIQILHILPISPCVAKVIGTV